MESSEILDKAGEALTVQRVYAQPFEKDGVTIIAGAQVSGGGGGGGGQDQGGQTGNGGGFGMKARPAGAFILKDNKFRWQPAVDVNRLAMVAGAVAVAYLASRARRTRPVTSPKVLLRMTSKQKKSSESTRSPKPKKSSKSSKPQSGWWTQGGSRTR